MFNGVKVFLKEGMDADVSFTSKLEKVTNSLCEVKSMTLEEAMESGLVKKSNFLDNYLNNLKSFINPKIKNNNAKILFDNMFGVGIKGLKPLSKMLNIRQFDIINENHDAFFNFVPPNPTEKAMAHLSERVVSGGYDYAIATDSDSDRLGVLDENGNNVTSNEILAMLYYYLVKVCGKKGDVVKNLATSIILDKLAERFGFNCHEVDVGFKNISSKLKQVDALIGGESSGGLTIRNYIYGKDSVFSSALFMEMQIVMGKPVSEIVKQVREFAGYDMICIEDEMQVSDMAIIDKIKQEDYTQMGAKSAWAINNNVKYYFDNDNWCLIRASGTEPLLRIFAEAQNKREAKRLIAVMKEQILKIDAKQ